MTGFFWSPVLRGTAFKLGRQYPQPDGSVKREFLPLYAPSCVGYARHFLTVLAFGFLPRSESRHFVLIARV